MYIKIITGGGHVQNNSTLQQTRGYKKAHKYAKHMVFWRVSSIETSDKSYL